MRGRISAKTLTGDTNAHSLPVSCYTIPGQVLLAIAERPPLTAKISKTQIDRLGDRIREASLTDIDLRLLDDYRRSFGEAYEFVVRTIRDQLQLEPTGRPAKSTSSIIEKLLRESIRLSQIQDIAGCRVIVTDVVEQERVVASLRTAFPGASIIDRRVNPSFGYKAVHVITTKFGKLVEIQVRTALQHLWAELSEKLSDVFDPSIKYGGGSNEIRNILALRSKILVEIEEIEKGIANVGVQPLNNQQREEIEKLKERIVELKKKETKDLSNAIIKLENKKRKQQ
jgi:putative GTP pyrophosphokinase